jgi:hypothetical protein
MLRGMGIAGPANTIHVDDTAIVVPASLYDEGAHVPVVEDLRRRHPALRDLPVVRVPDGENTGGSS